MVLYLLKGYQLINKKVVNKHIIKYLIISLILVLFSIKIVTAEIIENQYNLSFYKHYLYLISCFSIGLFEEVFFRIFVFYFIYSLIKSSKNQILKAVIYSSIVFGLAHITNFLNPDYEPLAVINQVLLAFGLGLLFQCLFIRLQNITIIVTLHALINYIGMYKVKLFNTSPSLIEKSYTYTDFMTTFIFIILIIIFIIVPICHLLINKINSQNEELI